MQKSEQKSVEQNLPFKGMLLPLRDAFALTIVAGILGLAVNIFHPNHIPVVAQEEYETLVPCPVPGGPVQRLEANDPSIYQKDTTRVDARLKAECQLWSLPQAVNVPYDYLDPTDPLIIRDLAKNIAHSGSKRVVVFGDGDNPDTGEQLGKEISGSGIKNVFYVGGGAPVLRSLSNKEVQP